MNFYKRHLGDIAKACSHLSQGAMGAYDLLLDWQYANEQPLPPGAAELYRVGRAYTKAERINVDLVLGMFFERVESGYVQKRVLEEIAKANAQADTNRRIAEEREARKRATNEARADHESLDESCTNRSTKDQPSQTPDSRLHQDQKKSSLRSDSSAASPADPPQGGLTPAQKAERLAKVADEAAIAYNAICAVPHGLMPKATAAGRSTRLQHVKRCLTVARGICQEQLGSAVITPAFWAAYMTSVQACEFHSGRQGGGKGHGGWIPDFEFLTQPKTMLKVFERAVSEGDA